MKMPSVLSAALRLVSLQFIFQQILLAIFGFAMFTAWLRLPDGNVFEVAASALIALAAIVIIFAGEAWLLIRLRSLKTTTKALAKGAVALFVAVLIAFFLSSLLAHASADDTMRAGYLNSRFPAGLRNIFSYVHLLALLQMIWDSLFWIGVIVFGMIAVAITGARTPLAALGSMMRSLTAWVVLSIATIVGSETTLRLMSWTPGHGLRIETASLVLRLVTTTLLDAVLLCLSLAVLVALVQRSDARYFSAVTDEGTSEVSQPRTVENP